MTSAETLMNIPGVIRTYNVSQSISTTTRFSPPFVITQTAVPMPHISPLECLGFAVLILSTVIGNTLVLSALFLDKRLHSPSFFLIGNMAIADLLLGLSVLPFSSLLELLNERWIFGENFCKTWLALDVLCCTASIIALMAVSVDRYIGVTRPLTYSGIMTTRRTIYLILLVWTISILTSVVPLFGLTDHRTFSTSSEASADEPQTCKVNKNTFYTIFSSLISFYIPVIILLILYSRVYQEAKKQGKKLEQEKRRIYEIDYQIAAEQARQRQNHPNGHGMKARTPSNQSDEKKHEVTSKLLRNDSGLDEECNLYRTLTATESVKLKNAYTNFKAHKTGDDDNTSNSGSSIGPHRKHKHRFHGKRLFSALKRNSLLSLSHAPQYNREMPPNNELLLIKRKLHNLKREKKAFRTVGLILGALLICWLPFFVILPIVSIQEHHTKNSIPNAENTWFKIAFWLGYCNSALNPFVYAFSNRAIRRAFRETIFRRCCCCFCGKSPDRSGEPLGRRRQRGYSGSLPTDTSQTTARVLRSASIDVGRGVSKPEKTADSSLLRAPQVDAPVISFADLLAENDEDDDDDDHLSSHDQKQPVHDSITPVVPKEQHTPSADADTDR